MPNTKQRLRKNIARVKVLEEFGFAVATPQACKIADALIEARKDSARLDWIRQQLFSGTNIDFTRVIADMEDGTNDLCVMIWKVPQRGPEAGCGKLFAGDSDFCSALDAAMSGGNDA